MKPNSPFFLYFKFNKEVDEKDVKVFVENEEIEIEKIDKRLFRATLNLPEGSFKAFLRYKGEIVDVKTIEVKKDLLTSLYNHAFGNWEIKENKMYFYDLGGNILAVYELFDKRGNPTEKAIFKRVKVE